MPRDERYPNPMINMSPDGLPGLFVVLAVVLGFVSLFVIRQVQTVLLWLVVAVALGGCGLGIYQWVGQRRGRS